jgi:hypothetical protein
MLFLLLMACPSIFPTPEAVAPETVTAPAAEVVAPETVTVPAAEAVTAPAAPADAASTEEAAKDEE